MENSSYGGSSVGSNIYGSSSVDLLRLREVEVKRSSNRLGSDSPVMWLCFSSLFYSSHVRIYGFRQIVTSARAGPVCHHQLMHLSISRDHCIRKLVLIKASMRRHN